MAKRYMVKFTINNSNAMHNAYETANSAREASNKVKAREAGCGRVAKIVAVVERP